MNHEAAIATLNAQLDSCAKDLYEKDRRIVELERQIERCRVQILKDTATINNLNEARLLAAAPAAPAVEQVHPVKRWEDRMREYFAQGSVQMRTPAAFMADEIADWRGAPLAADTDKVREAILALPLPAPTHLPYGLRYSGGDMHQLLELAADTAASMAAQAPVREVPEGWRLVPEQATEAMYHAGQDVPEPRAFGAVYRAMLAAAPLPAAPVQQEGEKP